MQTVTNTNFSSKWSVVGGSNDNSPRGESYDTVIRLIDDNI